MEKDSSKNNTLNFLQKTKKIAIEIIVIVFSVYVSIWLSNRNEYNKQQKETAEFLCDLKTDLQKDIENLEKEKAFTQTSKNALENLLKLSPEELKNAGTIEMNIVFNTRRNVEATYEGFKSSGKIGTIENRKLGNNIVAYYQENMSVTTEIEKDLNFSKKEIIELFGLNDFKATTLNNPHLRIKI